MNIGTIIALFGLVLMWVDLAIVVGCIHHHRSTSNIAGIAMRMNEQFGLDLPIPIVSWRPLIISASFMTPIAILVLAFGITLSIYKQ